MFRCSRGFQETCSQVLVGCGLVMFGTTLTHPPYFANGGSDEEGTARQSMANQLRCAVDSATLWIYACSLAAAVLASDGATGTCSRTPPLGCCRHLELTHGDTHEISVVCRWLGRFGRRSSGVYSHADGDAHRGGAVPCRRLLAAALRRPVLARQGGRQADR